VGLQRWLIFVAIRIEKQFLYSNKFTLKVPFQYSAISVTSEKADCTRIEWKLSKTEF
jgi:hypothetical protein